MKTIRGQILIFLMAGAIVIFGLLFAYSAVKLNQLPQLIKSQYSEIVSAKSNEVSKELNNFKEQITLTAKSSIVKSMDLERIKSYLPEFIINENYRNMTIAYPDGYAWSTLQDEFNISDQEQFKAIFLENQDFIISQPFYSPYTSDTSLPIITISHSVKSQRETVGLINLVIDTGFLDDVIRSMELKNGAYGWIINQEGMVVAHPDSGVPVQQNAQQYVRNCGIIENIQNSNEGAISYTCKHEEKMLAFFHKIEGAPDWYFLISISEQAIYGEINNIKNVILASILICLIALIIFAFFVSHSLSKPILDLKEVFERAANGNLNERANENINNELGIAAKSFNTMLEKIKNLTYKDNISGLYNYNGFLLELPYAIKKMTKGSIISIAIISIDDFKRINSVYGFDFGNQALAYLAEQLESYLKEGELAARFLGDEFILLLNEEKEETIKERISQLWNTCNQEKQIGDKLVHIKTSIGASLCPIEKIETEKAIYQANIAKLMVKREEGNNFKFFDFQLEEFIKKEQEIEDALYHALENKELKLVYQPIIELPSNKITMVEALLRWTNPLYSKISPAVLIEMAERNGFITKIGEWVLREACGENKKWQEAGYPPIKVAVNISAIQFEQSNLVETVKNVLAETGLDAKYLELEITEGISMSGGIDLFNKMNELKAMGISLSMDDFGTGYSSLSYFTRFPLDTLKIDRSFIQNMLKDETAKTIVKTIINMAKAMKMKTIAEGVETTEELIYLQQAGCDQIQGYLISRPTDAEDVVEMFKGL